MKKRRAKGQNWAKEIVYRGIKYRSSWEVYVQKLLLYSGINSQYEPRRYFLSQGVSYLPDFYLPELRIFIEVKGWLRQKDIVKLNMFKAKITSRLIYLGELELGYIYGGKPAELSQINYEKYIPSREELLRFQEYIRKVK